MTNHCSRSRNRTTGLQEWSSEFGIREPLYAIAISAKRYVLFNLDKDNRPVIRKAVAHGLGHWRVPYTEHDAPTSIPAPTIKLSDIGADLWQHDLWHQIIMAELEGHPDQVDLSPLPGLDRPAVSRYSASTPALLHWFDKFNRGKPYAERVKAFNFLLAYQVSSTALYSAIASGEIDAEFIDDGLPAVVAPFDDDPVRAAKKCFDRRSGRPVPPSILATYREAIADYHLHSKSKFDNADTTTRGLTERRHLQAVAVEYIGKEANRWEDQFHLGEMPEAQIEYGTSPKDKRQLVRLIGRAARKFGICVLADTAGLSRQQLSAVLARNSQPRPQTIKELLRAIMTLEKEGNDKRKQDAKVIARLQDRIKRSSLTAVAGKLRTDVSNLSKMLSGTRPLPASMIRKANQLFRKG